MLIRLFATALSPLGLTFFYVSIISNLFFPLITYILLFDDLLKNENKILWNFYFFMDF
jgi:hypothetical protein